MPRGEKKMDDFRFDIEGQKIVVPVWLVKQGGKYEEQRSVYFRAKYEVAGMDENDTDINKLRQTMLKKITDWYKIEWNLYIMVNTYEYCDREGQHVFFGYKFYLLGKRPDGRECFMEVPEPWSGADTFKGEKWLDENGFWNGKWRPEFRYGLQEPRDGRPEEGQRESNWNNEPMRSLLPATVETVNAVLAFEMKLKKLGEEMERRFAPDKVKDTIGMIQKAFEFPLALPDGPATPDTSTL